MNVIVLVFESGGSVVGGILTLLAIIGFFVLGKTFWFDIGIALGLVISGILFFIFNIFGMGGIKDLLKDKKKRIIAYVEIVLTIISLIIGLIFPAKLPEIEFSRFFSMFVQSIWISALILVFNLLYDNLSDGLWFPLTIGLLVLFGIIAGLALMMLFYFSKNNNALNFLAENLKYVDSEYIEERIRDYGKDDMKYIIEQYTKEFRETKLQESREYYTTASRYENYTSEEKEACIFNDYLRFFNPNNGQYVGYAYDGKATTKANSNVKIIEFTDCSVVACENDEYGFLRYYIKINTDDYTILNIQHEKFEDELADK